MTKYRVVFTAEVEREVDVPNDFNWSEAYTFVQEQLGWHALAHSPAAKVTINTSRVFKFDRS